MVVTPGALAIAAGPVVPVLAMCLVQYAINPGILPRLLRTRSRRHAVGPPQSHVLPHRGRHARHRV